MSRRTSCRIPQVLVWGVLSLLLLSSLATPGAIRAQAIPSDSPVRAVQSVLVVSASAEVEVAPDRAYLRVEVETRGRTAAEAAHANARVQSAVLDAVRGAGVPAAQLQTTTLSVSPEYEYPREGGRPTVLGYQARNSVEIEIRDLPSIGPVLDAALSVGATTVQGPRFALADPSSARRTALELAVRMARADAEAIAEAAGVRLGAVLEIVSGDEDRVSSGEFSMSERMQVATASSVSPVETGRLTIRASVLVRFAIQAP